MKSVGSLILELEQRGITARSGNRFGVGGLAHLLRNRFYLGEVVYRGETFPGPQPPIVDRATFDAVQDCLDAQVVARKNAPGGLIGSPCRPPLRRARQSADAEPHQQAWPALPLLRLAGGSAE